MEPKKLTTALLTIGGIQLLVGMLLFVAMGSRVFGTVSPVLLVGMGLLLLSCLVTMAGVYLSAQIRNQGYRESMRNLEQLNGKLREQKHDLMNHFQVVYGLMELGEYEEAHAYITPVFREITKLNRALKTAQPAVNALLWAKMEEAEKRHIDFYLEVGSNLKNLTIAPWDLCRILANLLDNAMTAAEKREGERRIQVCIRESGEAYQIEIANNGPEIPKELQTQIFLPGFSTKKEEGHGNGLAIVARLLREAGGELQWESTGRETSFGVCLPKK